MQPHFFVALDVSSWRQKVYLVLLPDIPHLRSSSIMNGPVKNLKNLQGINGPVW